MNRILENVTQEQLVQPSALLNLSSSTFVLFYFSIYVFLILNGFVFWLWRMLSRNNMSNIAQFNLSIFELPYFSIFVFLKNVNMK